MVDIKDKFTVGSKCVVAQDSDLRGDITIGNGCVLHPRCTVLAMVGPIIIGSNCVIEENVVILNRSKDPMVIGDFNLFQVGCRVESASIGSYNTFGARCRVSYTISVESNCSIGAGCVVLPNPLPLSIPPTEDASEELELLTKDTLPSRTAVFGGENRRRIMSEEGDGQTKALYAKHLDYLRETIPKFNKLKMF